MNTQTQKTDLQEKIATLTKKYELESKMADKLGSIKHMALLSWKDKERVIINPANIEEFKEVLNIFPATNKNTVIGTATDKYYKQLKTPFRIDIENPPVINSVQNYEVHIKYDSNGTDVQIELPISFIEGFTITGDRNITDCEYHYFIGHSRKELTNIRVRCYGFKGEQMGWFGGNKTLLSESVTGEIIKHLTK